MKKPEAEVSRRLEVELLAENHPECWRTERAPACWEENERMMQALV